MESAECDAGAGRVYDGAVHEGARVSLRSSMALGVEMRFCSQLQANGEKGELY